MTEEEIKRADKKKIKKEMPESLGMSNEDERKRRRHSEEMGLERISEGKGGKDERVIVSWVVEGGGWGLSPPLFLPVRPRDNGYSSEGFFPPFSTSLLPSSVSQCR